jgi:hypothetical protein
MSDTSVELLGMVSVVMCGERGMLHKVSDVREWLAKVEEMGIPDDHVLEESLLSLVFTTSQVQGTAYGILVSKAA